MNVGNKVCSVCGKEKESKYIEFANIFVYIECECEKQNRLEKEKK